MQHHVRGTLTLAVAVLAAASLLATGSAAAGEIAVDVAPATLNLQSGGTVVTVHTDIPYGDVDVVSVYLAGVAIESWKADDRGYFVAKFDMDEVKTIDGLVINGLNTFQLVGLDVFGEPFWGEQEVMVIDRGASQSEPRHTADE
jgi:hypothetical protein